jgi:hypothetical protein
VRRRRAPEPFFRGAHMRDTANLEPARRPPGDVGNRGAEPAAGVLCFCLRNATAEERREPASPHVPAIHPSLSSNSLANPHTCPLSSPPLQSAGRESELSGCGPVVLVFEVRRRGAPSGGPPSWLELSPARQPPPSPLVPALRVSPTAQAFFLRAGFLPSLPAVPRGAACLGGTPTPR